MAEPGAVVDEWSREPLSLLSVDSMRVLAVAYIALSASSVLLYPVYLAVTWRRKQPALLSLSLFGFTVGIALTTTAVVPRLWDPTAVATDSWVACVVFFVGDLLAHWGLLAFCHHIYAATIRSVFIIWPRKSAELERRHKRLSLVTAALQPLTIGTVVGTGLPGMRDSVRQVGLQAFWVVQVSVIFGVLFISVIIPAIRSVLNFHSELAEETPASVRRELKIVEMAMIFFATALSINIPTGLACAFVPDLRAYTGSIYYYYALNMHSVLNLFAMTTEVYKAYLSRGSGAAQQHLDLKETLPLNLVTKALGSRVRHSAGSKIGRSSSSSLDMTWELAAFSLEVMGKKLSLGSATNSVRSSESLAEVPTWEQGTQLGMLQALTEVWGGCEGLTTQDVCHERVMPATMESQQSLWSTLKANCERQPELWVLSGCLCKPTVFVSHCWSSQFLDIFSIMRNYNRNSKRDNAFFFDVISMNQHSLMKVVEGHGGEQDVTGFSLLSNLRRSISTPGRVLLAMTPYNEPLMLNRAWCLYEIHEAYTIGAKLTCGFTEAEEMMVLEKLREDEIFLSSLLSSVDCSNAEATKEEDRTMILQRIEKTGIMQFNQYIVSKLRSTLCLLMTGVSADAQDLSRTC